MFVNSSKVNDPASTVTGYMLALTKMSVAERAFVGARIVLGQVQPVELRKTQAALLARVSVPSVEAALAILKENPGLEGDVLFGRYSLIAAGVLAKHSQPFVERFLTATTSELEELGRYAGTDVVWDHMIAPNIGAEEWAA
jgi:hypothetical protein